jgi:tetratricopeptide (TPR) repeat protein
MHLATHSKLAGELVDDAMSDVDLFRQTKQRERLEAAATKLLRAQAEDSEYLPALYGRAVVDQLAGRTADAVEEFERIFAERPPFVDEAEYHLGIAYYNRYNWLSLDRAIAHLSSVAGRTQDPMLECQARVGLARAYGMRMIPQDPHNANLDEIQHYADLLEQEAEKVGSVFQRLPRRVSFARDQLKSDLHNARALAWMYHSDFFGSVEAKCSALENGLSELKVADEQNPKDWAIHCDFGSIWMRLGYWRGSEANFVQALAYLTGVVETLRPDYGFALYEIGRTRRLMGHFTEAIEYFGRALSIPYKYRDVSDRRLLMEKTRAEAYSAEYP